MVDIPCKIYGFIAIENVPHAIVHPCNFKSVDYLVITKKWKLCYSSTKNVRQDAYEVVACDTLSGHCFMFPDTVPEQCIKVIDVEHWPAQFTEAVNVNYGHYFPVINLCLDFSCYRKCHPYNNF